jgi:hypothetical protein
LCGTVIIDTGDKPGIGLYVLRGEYGENSVNEGVTCNHRAPIESPDGIIEWIPITKINDLPLVKDLPILLPRVLQARLNDPPFSAIYTFNEQGQVEVAFG